MDHVTIKLMHSIFVDYYKLVVCVVSWYCIIIRNIKYHIVYTIVNQGSSALYWIRSKYCMSNIKENYLNNIDIEQERLSPNIRLFVHISKDPYKLLVPQLHLSIIK